MRRLTPGEIDLAGSVFGEVVDYARVRIVISPSRRLAVTLGSWIVFPRGSPADFASADLSARAWFIHEMTHVLQFQQGRMRTLWSWLKTAAGGGYLRARGYRYGLPLKDWRLYNLEQQAAMIEHAYVLRQTGLCSAAPEGVRLEDYEQCAGFLVASSLARKTVGP